MTELETIQRAKMYMDKLAEGVDPITEQPLVGTASLSNPRLARCFQYVSGILDKVIQNGGQVGAVEKADFSITPEQLTKVKLPGQPLRIADFSEVILQATDYAGMKKLSPVKLTLWMEKQGLLVKETGPDGKAHRVPTPAGKALGISTKMCSSRSGGEYLGVFYDDNAQKYLLSNLFSIMES